MFVTSFYLVRDKLCFSQTRWMSYGLCSLAGGMWNPKTRKLWRISKSWRYYEGDLKGIWRQRWRRFCLRNFQTHEDFQRSMVKICHEKCRSQHTFRRYDEDVFKAKYQFQEECTSHILEIMKLANMNRSRIIPRQGG